MLLRYLCESLEKAMTTPAPDHLISTVVVIHIFETRGSLNQVYTYLIHSKLKPFTI